MDIATLRAEHGHHWRMACAIRALTLDAVAAANSGHSGMPMGMADVATVLFSRHLKFDPTAPQWPDRDRFILSAGHGSMLLYALLHLTGYADMPMEEIRNFRQWGARTAGHPEYGHAGGIESTTGPLGQGLAMAVGSAIAEEHLRARFGARAMNHRTWVIAGDGCLMEGINHEAIGLAGHLQLGRLTVLWDDNKITIDGATGDGYRIGTIGLDFIYGIPLGTSGWTLITGGGPSVVLTRVPEFDFEDTGVGAHYLFGFGVLVVAFFLFQANVFGGCDAKLIAAVSIWTGFASFGPFALYTTLAGGLMAAGLLFARKWAPVIPGAPNFVNRLLDSKSGIPYGVAIMVGALAALPDMAVAPVTLTLP